MCKDLRRISDPDGSLFPIEFSELPFLPKRVFYVTGVPAGEERGKHAHYTTKQILICVQGSILAKIDTGAQKTEVLLKSGQYTIVNELEWDSQVFLTGDDILLVICSTSYDKSDYIEDYGQFLELV
jgi:hypothetical protein